MFRKGIFISYSHKDVKWLNTLLTFLQPYTRGEKITVWSDQQIKPNLNWEEEIKSNLNSCRVAILLVSSNFLASDYIVEKELPILLQRRNEGELIIYWIAVSHSAYRTTALADIQSANIPSKPLNELAKPERDKVLVEITEKIANAMNLNPVSNVLKIIDDFIPQQKAFLVEQPVYEKERNYSNQAKQEQDTIALISVVKEIITQLFKVIPEFLINLFKIIASPREFPLSKLPKEESDTKTSLEESLKFILISYVLTILLTAWKNNTDNFYKDLGVVAISTLINISIFAFATFTGWKIFGSKHKFLDYFIIYSYLSGVVFIDIALFGIISDGYIKFFDKELYDNLLKVKGYKLTFNSEWFHNTTYQVGWGIIGFGFLISIIWGWIGWGAYRIMNNFTKLKSFSVLFVTGILSWIAIAISLLITNGLKN